MENKRKVIVLSGGKTTIGLTEKLLDKYDVAILEPQIAAAHNQRFGEKVIPIGRLVDQNIQQQCLNLTAQMAGRISASGIPFIANNIQSQPEWEPFRGDGLDQQLGGWMPSYLYMSLSRQIIQIAALDRLIQERQVAMVVTHEDVTEPFGGLAIWSNARGIPTMHIPHGNSFMTQDYSPDIHEKSISACIAATPHEERFYRARGYDGEIRLTGSPTFDYWAEFKRDRDYARRLLKLDFIKPVVVYMTSWGQRTNANDDLSVFERAFDAVMLAAKGADWQLVIKLHPGEAQGTEEQYANRARAFGVRCVIMRPYLEFVLSAADAVISLGPSNVLIDAAMIGTPSVAMNIAGFRVNHPAVREIDIDAEAIKKEIEFVLSADGQESWNNYREDFVYQHAFKNDGHAAERILQWIGEKTA